MLESNSFSCPNCNEHNQIKELMESAYKNLESRELICLAYEELLKNPPDWFSEKEISECKKEQKEWETYCSFCGKSSITSKICEHCNQEIDHLDLNTTMVNFESVIGFVNYFNGIKK